jgi:hypothetical protein
MLRAMNKRVIAAVLIAIAAPVSCSSKSSTSTQGSSADSGSAGMDEGGNRRIVASTLGFVRDGIGLQCPGRYVELLHAS